MKRTKLSSSAPLPPGSMPPTSTWYEVPRCFACDDPIKSHRFSTSLLLGHTHYSQSSIPGKLGEYIGEGFVVVVTSEDALCRTCMNLLNTMDRLEEELKDHRTKLVGNLRRKYGLDPGGKLPAARPIRKPVTKVDDDDDIIEIQSDEEWTPYNKRRKVTPSTFSRTKILTCNVCKMEFTDLNRFMTHLKMHREAVQQQKDEVPPTNETKVESDIPKSFKCGCCTISFDKKEALAIHMRQHTGDQLLNRPVSASTGDTVSLLRSNLPPKSSNGNKLFPKPTSQTVVEMKLIMDAGLKKSSTKDNPPLEKPVTVTKVTEKDSGGKVCLLALWNSGSGSCSDHTDCQNPSCASENHPKTTVISTQQTPHVAVSQEELFIPRVVVRQSQDSISQVISDQSQIKVPLVSQSQFQIPTPVGQQSKLAIVPSISQADTHVITIPHSVSAPTQLTGSKQPLSHIVVSIPNQSSINYNISTQQPSGFLGGKSSLESKEIILNTSDNQLPKALIDVAQSSDLNQKIVLLPSNDQSSSSFQVQLSEKLNSTIIEESEPVKAIRSMPSLDDDIAPPLSTEHAIIQHGEIGNLGIANVSSVEESETVPLEEDETDWYLASEQSNAVLEAPHTLWGNQESEKIAIAGIDQVDGARSTSTLPFDVREQSDSVDEDEKSEYFTSRYVVDSETRQKAEELGDAIFAAFRS